MQTNYLNTIKNYINNPKQIRDIFIGIDASSSKTGVFIMINRIPAFADECNTLNDKKSDGDKIIESLEARLKLLAKSFLIPLIKKAKEQNHFPWIILVVENGSIPNATTARKLSLWSGVWFDLFALYIKKYQHNLRGKFIAPNEWQLRAFGLNKEEKFKLRTNLFGEKFIKEKSLQVANKELEPFGVFLTSDNIADAYHIAKLAYVVNDFTAAHIRRKKMEHLKLKLKKQIPVLETRKIKLKGELQEKKNKKILKLSKKGVKLEIVEVEKKSLLDFANASQKERWKKITSSLWEIDKQLKQIEEDKKIKNKKEK